MARFLGSHPKFFNFRIESLLGAIWKGKRIRWFVLILLQYSISCIDIKRFTLSPLVCVRTVKSYLYTLCKYTYINWPLFCFPCCVPFGSSVLKLLTRRKPKQPYFYHDPQKRAIWEIFVGVGFYRRVMVVIVYDSLNVSKVLAVFKTHPTPMHAPTAKQKSDRLECPRWFALCWFSSPCRRLIVFMLSLFYMRQFLE